jgi:hypothetical protein
MNRSGHRPGQHRAAARARRAHAGAAASSILAGWRNPEALTDLIQDPPFTKLDLISCRNVLIFFGSIRKNVIGLFHYALKPGGILVLGPSETESENLFSIVPGAHSTYTKNETVGPATALPSLSGWPPSRFDRVNQLWASSILLDPGPIGRVALQSITIQYLDADSFRVALQLHIHS